MKIIETVFIAVFVLYGGVFLYCKIKEQNLNVVKTVILCAETEEFSHDAYKTCQHFSVKAGILNEE